MNLYRETANLRRRAQDDLDRRDIVTGVLMIASVTTAAGNHAVVIECSDTIDRDDQISLLADATEIVETYDQPDQEEQP